MKTDAFLKLIHPIKSPYNDPCSTPKLSSTNKKKSNQTNKRTDTLIRDHHFRCSKAIQMTRKHWIFFFVLSKMSVTLMLFTRMYVQIFKYYGPWHGKFIYSWQFLQAVKNSIPCNEKDCFLKYIFDTYIRNISGSSIEWNSSHLYTKLATFCKKEIYLVSLVKNYKFLLCKSVIY